MGEIFQGSGLRAWTLGFQVQGVGFRVQGRGLTAEGRFLLKTVLMLIPDGVVNGNYRTGLAGQIAFSNPRDLHLSSPESGDLQCQPGVSTSTMCSHSEGCCRS